MQQAAPKAKRKSNKKAGLREVALATALIAVFGIVIYGAAVYQSSRHRAANSSVASSPSASPAATATPKLTATPTLSNEISVTELGFKMTLPAGLTGLQYVAQTNLTGSGSNGSTYTLSTSTFSTASLVAADPQCSAANGAIGSIAEYSEDPNGFVPGVVKKVGNFYLTFSTPQSPCSNAEAAVQLQLSQSKLLQQAFDSATAL